MIWDALVAGSRVGVFTSATLIFIFCAGGNASGAGDFAIFIALIFFFSTAAATLFKLFDLIIMEEK